MKKKRTIRVRFFGSLAVYTIVNYLLIALALFSYDYYEFMTDPSLLPEEAEEVFIVLAVMMILFPVSLLVAWWISRLLLRPWRSMVTQAEGISKGCLEDRIDVQNHGDEIGRLASTLNHTFDQYTNLLSRMQRFSYDASHQLRNPLAAIRTNSEVCLKNPRSEEEYREVIAGILENAIRLSRTVDQLLLLARAAGSSLDEFRREVDLEELAGSLIQEGRLIGEVKNVAVDLKVSGHPLAVRGIPDLIREALANLLDNALKFTPDGGRIEVSLSSVDRTAVRVEVCDTGPGLTPSRKATIFRPFERGNGNGDVGEGTGLGLAIVADVCRAHDAPFGVEDHAGGGCCFWMEFPV